MKWKNFLVAVLATGFACGSALAGDKQNDLKKQEAIEALTDALEQAKQTGKPVDIHVEPEDPQTVQLGDLVKVNYTAELEDGSLVYTTMAEVANDPRRKKSEGFLGNQAFGPEETVAGQGGFIPAVGALTVGMKPGEKKTVTLPPENAFGTRDPKKMEQLPCEKRMPKSAVLDPHSYVGRFGTFPIVGKEVNLAPYFKSKVVEVTENYVRLDSNPKDGSSFQENYGTAVVRVQGDEIITTLTPKMGADFEVNDQRGKIISADGSNFTVDLNPPLAGKPVVLDVEVVSLTKASAFKGKEITWLEDYDKGLEKAKKNGKPTFLLLYAAWCSWSKKTMNETLADPRIKMLKDNFVWVKVNSDEHKDIYELYDQKGFPLMVLLNSNGDVVKKIDGYRDGGALAMELKNMVGGQLSVVRSQ